MIEYYKKYFNEFKNKNIDFLREIFDENISIVDWTGSAKGIKEAIDFNKKIFDNIQAIQINIIDYSIKKNIAFFKLEIIADNEVVKVIDVIEIKNNKIIKIEAYKQ